MAQVERAVKIAKVKYPEDENTIVWVFNQSSNHTARAEDALNAKKMNMHPGGNQPLNRNTVFNNEQPSLVSMSGPNKGKAKGLLQVLTEHGHDVSELKKLKKDGCIVLLESHGDFKSEMSKVAHLIKRNGQLCFFLPKFHCELIPFEQCWCRAKVYTQGHCNYSITGLRQSWRDGLETVSVQDLREIFLTSS